MFCLIVIAVSLSFALAGRAAVAAQQAPTAPSLPVGIAGITVTPHVRANSLRYRSEPDGELGARVQLFIRNITPTNAGPEGTLFSHVVAFNGQEPQRHILEGDWAWHDTPSHWHEDEVGVPPGALVVWSFNTKNARWGVGKSFQLSITDWQHARKVDLPITLQPPGAWLSAVTFISTDGNVRPDYLIFHLANNTATPLRLLQCRLYLPSSNDKWRILFPQPPLTNLQTFPATGIIPAGDKGGARLRTGRLPLTYGALEVTLADAQGRAFSLWAHRRIKRETFDISGGWVQDSGGPVPTMTHEPFLKTLKRMHVNTAHLTAVPGYTDQIGPNGLYTRYPLKRFGKPEPLVEYDTEAMLPLIHAIEFLGEPQYEHKGIPLFPQAVQQALLPYAKTRLPTTVTLSDESSWRYYAGLSDYPHFDAYRIAAPAVDAWELYDRWPEGSIAWGAPLETIGALCRCLREISRPAPIAYWSQGPHFGLEVYDGRKRTSPTPDEIRLQAYHALASRITSLYWFNLSLRALTQFRDTMDEITRIGREIKMLEDFYLEGDAYRYQQTRREGKLDWDLASIVSPRGAVLFALDLDYAPDRSAKVFEFKRPRDARFFFDLPAYLRRPADVFRVDANGVHDVKFTVWESGVEIVDKQNKVAIYLAAQDRELRAQIEGKRQALISHEQSFNFDPAVKSKDFEALKAGLVQK
jgi:hypothetical protein